MPRIVEALTWGASLANPPGINGTNGADSLWGADADDYIYGHGGNDRLKGYGGTDYLDGGAGIDTTYYADSTAGVVVNLATGRGYGGSAEGDRLVSIEYVFGSFHNDTITGNDANNELYGLNGDDILKGGGGTDGLAGDDGDDILKGGGGADYLEGGYGSDTADYSTAAPYAGSVGVTVYLYLNQAQYGEAAGDTFSSIENITGSAYRDTLFGDNNRNVLRGLNGADSLTGLDGDDLLEGGNDNDFLSGGRGHDTLDGGPGADSMYGDEYGQAGYDTYIVDHAQDHVWEYIGHGVDTVRTSVSYALPQYSEIELLETTDASGTAAINLTGNDVHNTITGNNGANVLTGLGGRDVLFGGGGSDTMFGGAGDDSLLGEAGADTMIGGLGNDIYLVDDAGDIVIEVASEVVGEGLDAVFTSVSYALNPNAEVETLASTYGSTGLSLTGSNTANEIIGDAGDNRIDGRGGADRLRGFLGNDLYVVDNAADAVVENGGQGSDEVRTSVSYALTAGADVEILCTTDDAGTAAINLTGNASGQQVRGNNGANVVNGGAGNDQLIGRGGQDSFRFDTALDAALNVDVVADFSVADDTIVLENAIFAAFANGPLATERFVVGTAALDASDNIIYNAATGALSYDSDGVGAAAAVRFATLSPGLALTHQDFLVV